jgi:hypothetical protein
MGFLNPAAVGRCMSDTKRLTISLPEDKYQELVDRLDTFTSDTARFQHLVELYLSDQLNQTDDSSRETEIEPSTPSTRDGSNDETS